MATFKRPASAASGKTRGRPSTLPASPESLVPPPVLDRTHHLFGDPSDPLRDRLAEVERGLRAEPPLSSNLRVRRLTTFSGVFFVCGTLPVVSPAVEFTPAHFSIPRRLFAWCPHLSSPVEFAPGQFCGLFSISSFFLSCTPPPPPDVELAPGACATM